MISVLSSLVRSVDVNKNVVEELKKLLRGEDFNFDLIFNELKDLFAKEANIYVVSNNKIRKITDDELKRLVLLRRDLPGKIKQAVRSNHPFFKRKEAQIGFKIKRNTNLNDIAITISNKFGINIDVVKRFFEETSLFGEVRFVSKSFLDRIDYRTEILSRIFLKKNATIQPTICPICGLEHNYSNLRILLPINMYSEKTRNFLSNLDENSKLVPCPECYLKILKVIINSEKYLPTINKYKTKTIILPYHPTEIDLVEEALINITNWLKSNNNSILNFILHLPEEVYSNIEKGSKKGSLFRMPEFIGGFELFLIISYISTKAEKIIKSYRINRWDLLYLLGKNLHNKPNSLFIYKQLNNFLIILVNNKITNFKDLLIFVSDIISNFKIDFDRLYQYTKASATSLNYIPAAHLYLLEVMKVHENFENEKKVFISGITLGKLWKRLMKHNRFEYNVNENAYKSKIFSLDSTSNETMLKVLRKMIGEISTVFPDEIEKISWILPYIVSNRKMKEIFLTGVYFGFFSNVHESNQGGERNDGRNYQL